MILFSNDKEIIFKITNAVLLLWLVAATAIAVSNVIDLVIKEPTRTYTYEEYAVSNCFFAKEVETNEVDEDARCLAQFNDYKFSNENSDHYKVRNLYVSLANVVIVSGVMFYLNKKK